MLGGAPGLVLAIPPRFKLSTSQSSRQGTPVKNAFHPESPAGSLLKQEELKKEELKEPIFVSWDDPFSGQGGFGASTAQFGLLWAALSEKSKVSHGVKSNDNYSDNLKVWQLYRDLPHSGAQPSGADLAVQLEGGLLQFELSKWKRLPPIDLGSEAKLLIFSASAQVGRKVATHVHLDQLHENYPQLEQSYPKLEHLVLEGIDALKRKDFVSFGRTLTFYASELANLRLEAPSAYSDRMELLKLEGVLGVKGCGALLADTLIVLLRPEAEERVISHARDRGLRLIANLSVLGLEPGLRQENIL